MKRWIAYLIMALLAFVAFDYYYLSKLTAPLHTDFMWKKTEKQSPASVSKVQDVPEEILALRQRHHLRPLTERENGIRVQDVASGIYGFAACDVQTVHATRTNRSFLEIHKHLDGIVFYVGYASKDHVEKYLTRQKNFHILVLLEPRGKASLLFEIPVAFVSKCAFSSVGEGSQFDFF